MKIREQVTSDKWQVTGTGCGENRVTRHVSRVTGFTMVEIAICLAIIGIALIAIIGVLPIGINVQKENRQETLVNQDAAVFLENIRNGARGLDDLTNYVLAITNTWTYYKGDGTVLNSGVDGFTQVAGWVVNFGMTPFLAITNGVRIIGLLSTPEYTDFTNGAPLPSLVFGGVSNHVVAYVRSLSGPASEKPPQDNPIIIGDAFSYKIICNNAPVAVYTPPVWQRGQSYNPGDEVYWLDNATNGISWRAAAPTQAGDEPDVSPLWAKVSYPQQLTANLRELRLTFLWPLLPNGNTGPGRHTFATTVAGQMMVTPFGTIVPEGDKYLGLYFFQPQSFTSAP